jgi:hypothetical protein
LINERLLEIMRGASATPEQVEEAVRINTESRLRALKIGFLIMAGVALIAIFPCQSPARLPARRDPARPLRDAREGN